MKPAKYRQVHRQGWMSKTTTPQPDATSEHTVVIDIGKATAKWRWRCPNGHCAGSWAPTNNHVWCKGCRRMVEAGEDVDPEHYELHDAKTGDHVHWEDIELVDSNEW